MYIVEIRLKDTEDPKGKWQVNKKHSWEALSSLDLLQHN